MRSRPRCIWAVVLRRPESCGKWCAHTDRSYTGAEITPAPTTGDPLVFFVPLEAVPRVEIGAFDAWSAYSDHVPLTVDLRA